MQSEKINKLESYNSFATPSNEGEESSKDSIDSLSLINIKPIVTKNQNRNNNKITFHTQQTRFLMSKYMPTDLKMHKGLSLPVNLAKPASPKKSTTELLKQLEPPKTVKPRKSYYLNPQEIKMQVPKIPTEKYRIRMSVDFDKLKQRKFKIDSENVPTPKYQRSSTNKLMEKLDDIEGEAQKTFKLKHASNMTFITSPKFDKTREMTFDENKPIDEQSEYSSFDSESEIEGIVPDNLKSMVTNMTSKLMETATSIHLEPPIDSTQYDKILKEIIER